MAEIVLDRVTKSYPNGAAAVKDLSITIADGEFIILVGPSGCGKSTTLNMIAGLEDISSGELSIGGERVNEKAPKDRDIAMVFQSYALYPHMTVRQNIAFPLTLAKMNKAEIAQKVDEAAKVLDLTALLDRKPAQLSGGQRQRVAMGRAIVRNPKAFLMDEPLSNLDAKLRVQMRSEIARLQDKLGTTTVYVTHDQTEAMTLGDRVVVLLAGEVQQIGTPEELYNRPANLFVAGFIGSPAMNFFPATITDVGVRLPFGEVTLTQEVHDLLVRHQTPNNVIAGIRPEHLEDAAVMDGYARIRALIFDVTVDFVESLGADKYLHFRSEGCRRAGRSACGVGQRVGRRRKRVRGKGFHRVRRPSRADTIQLACDTSKLSIFDADTGKNLTLPEPTTAGLVIDVPAKVRAHLREHFARTGITAEPVEASVTFLGTERIDVLRFGPDGEGVNHYVSVGCSRHPMFDPDGAGDRCAARTAGRGRRRAVRTVPKGPSAFVGDPGRGSRRRRPDPGTGCADRSGDTAVGGCAVLRFPVGPQRYRRCGIDRPAAAGDGAGRNPDHRDRGGVGAAQGRRCHAGGVGAGRRRRAGPRRGEPRGRARASGCAGKRGTASCRPPASPAAPPGSPRT